MASGFDRNICLNKILLHLKRDKQNFNQPIPYKAAAIISTMPCWLVPLPLTTAPLQSKPLNEFSCWNYRRVRLGSIRNKNNWNTASKRLFGSYCILIPEYLDFHSGYSTPRSRIAGIYSGTYSRIYSYSGISQTNAPYDEWSLTEKLDSLWLISPHFRFHIIHDVSGLPLYANGTTGTLLLPDETLVGESERNKLVITVGSLSLAANLEPYQEVADTENSTK